VNTKINLNVVGALLAAVMIMVGTAPAEAGVKYKDGDKYIKLGGRIQLQYHMVDPDTGSPSDEQTDSLFFRRFRPYIEGSVHKDWAGKFQFDLGKADGTNEVSIKDAYMQYKGFKNMKVTIGNAHVPFSREALTSSKKQQLVERTFVGDHNFGTPDRQAGVHLTGHSEDKMITWGASLAMAAIDPDTDKLDFDTLVNRNDDFNEGVMIGGRVDFHPFGLLKKSQGDFKGDMKATFGIAAFSWSNDDDNNTNTDAAGNDTSGGGKADVDTVTGLEVSGAFRASGFSADLQYNLFQTETVDSNVTAGIYQNGETDLENYAVELGYMLSPKKFELVAGYELQDADTYADEWTRTSIGANYFFVGKHDIKVQLTYRMGENLEGVTDVDANELFIQTQYVF
jgi:hypothetical protein